MFLPNLMTRRASRTAPKGLILSSSQPTIAFSKVWYLAFRAATSRPRFSFGDLVCDGLHSPLHPSPPETVVAANVSSAFTPGKLPHLNIEVSISHHRFSCAFLLVYMFPASVFRVTSAPVKRLPGHHAFCPFIIHTYEAPTSISTQSKTFLTQFHGARSPDENPQVRTPGVLDVSTSLLSG